MARIFPRRILCKLWLFVHILILVLFALGIVKNGFNLRSDLFSMLPSSQQNRAVEEADARLTKGNADTVFILCANADFDSAKNCAAEIYSILSKDYAPYFESITLYHDASLLGSVEDFLYQWRAVLLPPSVANEILSSEEGRTSFIMRSRSTVFSGLTVSSLSHLAEDPFLLTEEASKSYLKSASESGTALMPKDGVLSAYHNGAWYIMIQGVLSKKGDALAGSKGAVPAIYKVCTPFEADNRIVYSGTPFHSYESSSSASREISIISTISLLAVLLLLFAVFRTALPILCSFAAILVSLIAAFCVTHFAFSGIHLLTLVFGTSLIGCGIDYSLHFFIVWKAESSYKTGAELLQHLLKPLTLSLLSTGICYLVLLFAPFLLLREIALFSLAGILSAYLTVVCVFPLLPLPPQKKRGLKLSRLHSTFARYIGKAALFACVALALCSAVCLFLFRKNAVVKNNLSGLYRMQGRLKDDTILSSEVLRYSPSGWFIVSGKTLEEVLLTEEAVLGKLKALPCASTTGFVATSAFIPSKKTQELSLKAVSSLMECSREQAEFFGLEEEDIERLNLWYNGAKTFLEIESEVPPLVKTLLNMLWIGEKDGMYYSVILPSMVSDEASFREIAADWENVYFENKVKDISSSLDTLTRLILILFGISFAAVLVVLALFYKAKEVVRIACVPVLSVLVAFATCASFVHRVDFFCVTALVLVFGLGLDYIIYMVEEQRSKHIGGTEGYAITLSFLTTLLSFGALALSSFVPVQTIGLCIAFGLTAAFLCTKAKVR